MSHKAAIAFVTLGAINVAAATAAGASTGDLSTEGVNALSIARKHANSQILAQNEAPPQSEGVLRKIIEDMQQGKPDYDIMEPRVREALKEQFQAAADIYRHLGALQSLKYVQSRNGSDVYKAIFQNAAVMYTIRLSASGQVDGLFLQPAFPW